MFQKGAALSLIGEKACLLPFEPIYVEAKAVFASYIVCGVADYKTVFLAQLGFEGECCFAFVVYIFYQAVRSFDQGCGNFVA